MKKSLTVLIFLALVAGCGKNNDVVRGKVIYKIQYSTAKVPFKKTMAHGDIYEKRYTQFGEYITSITPTTFLGSISITRLLGVSESTSIASMTLILRNPPARDDYNADFSNNAVVQVVPVLNGGMTCNNNSEDGNDSIIYCYLTEITPFTLMYSQIQNLKQTVELPAQYNGINLTQFNQFYGFKQYYCDSVKNGAILTVDMYPLKEFIEYPAFKYMADLDIYLGLTDSTRLFKQGDNVPFPATFPPSFKSPGFFDAPLIWSNQFIPWTYNPPLEGQTLTLLCTLQFDIEKLIQIYAGADNVPYTSDDIIIYAPNFWDRMTVNMSVN